MGGGSVQCAYNQSKEHARRCEAGKGGSCSRVLPAEIWSIGPSLSEAGATREGRQAGDAVR
eukprot:1537118-Rhodomonas_salina.1